MGDGQVWVVRQQLWLSQVTSGFVFTPGLSESCSYACYHAETNIFNNTNRNIKTVKKEKPVEETDQRTCCYDLLLYPRLLLQRSQKICHHIFLIQELFCSGLDGGKDAEQTHGPHCTSHNVKWVLGVQRAQDTEECNPEGQTGGSGCRGRRVKCGQTNPSLCLKKRLSNTCDLLYVLNNWVWGKIAYKDTMYIFALLLSWHMFLCIVCMYIYSITCTVWHTKSWHKNLSL